MMMVEVSGMYQGSHGIHLHETGRCDGPKFASAGAHWNPDARKHGRDNPAGAHLGDLPNLDVSATGAATATFSMPGALRASGTPMLADADGTALVIHAKADDYRTDPSGASGDRIACAVLAPPK
jgi:Cu-Zn family superoxide dismutase